MIGAHFGTPIKNPLAPHNKDHNHLSLPVESILPSLVEALRASTCVVLSAAPGAGKTTRVPLAFLDIGLIKGRIVMLEPRRLAAIRAAQYMASLLGEQVGETVGYRIRGESRVGAATRIEVVTEGILTRLLQTDPALTGIDLLIFDEFHERSLHADLGLALARDAQQALREDLKILVMSATLDGVAISRLLDNAPVIESEGRQFPVSIVYQPRSSSLTVESDAALLIQRALKEQTGDILVFLPGQGEIRRTQQALDKLIDTSAIKIHSLFGEGSPVQQKAALSPDGQGKRKVILSTSIAETSLTIDGVNVVVDAGLVRTARFDARRGMSGLMTIPVSQATAEQRAGRAGRQQAGACYRLWSESQHSRLARYPSAEILQSDLMPLALELALWGSADQHLCFLDPPPRALLAQAREALQRLGAIDTQYKITCHGRAMAQIPTHPRIAHMLLSAKEKGLGNTACDVAALLEERDLLRHSSSSKERDVDFHSRWQVLQHGGGDTAARDRVNAQSSRLRKLLKIHSDVIHEDKLGLMLALCYPERIAKRRDGKGERWQMAGGIGAVLPASNPFVRSEWIAVADVDSEGRDAKIYLAAELDEKDLEMFFPEWIFNSEEVFWSERDEAVIAREVRRFGDIILSEQSLSQASLSPDRLAALNASVATAFCVSLRKIGWSAIPLNDATRRWLQRAQWLQTMELSVLADFPDMSEAALLASLEEWLIPFLVGINKRSQLVRVDLHVALLSRFTYQQQQLLDALAPSHITVPTGSSIPLDYSGTQPVLAVRLQEMFGELDTPRIVNGKIPVLLHLLSPGRTPLAVTQDLASFWQKAYKEVCKDMRGQYKRHYWPDNPLEAEPTKRSKAADDRARKNNFR